MALAYVVETESELAEILPTEYLDGTLLAEADESIFQEAYVEMEVTPLADFMGQDHAEIMEGTDGDVCAEEPWFDADEGLETVQSLISFLQDNPELIRGSGLLEALKSLEDILMACADDSIRWRLALDV